MNCEVGIRTVDIKEMYYCRFRCYRLIFDFGPIQCTFLLREVSHTVYTMHWAVYIIQYTVYGIQYIIYIIQCTYKCGIDINVYCIVYNVCSYTSSLHLQHYITVKILGP